MLSLLGWGWAAPWLVLPPEEPRALWTDPAALAGVSLEHGSPRVTVDVDGESWELRTGPENNLRVARVAAPTTPEEREQVAHLAASLTATLPTVALNLPAPAPEPVSRPAPEPAPAPEVAPAEEPAVEDAPVVVATVPEEVVVEPPPAAPARRLELAAGVAGRSGARFAPWGSVGFGAPRVVGWLEVSSLRPAAAPSHRIVAATPGASVRIEPRAGLELRAGLGLSLRGYASDRILVVPIPVGSLSARVQGPDWLVFGAAITADGRRSVVVLDGEETSLSRWSTTVFLEFPIRQ